MTTVPTFDLATVEAAHAWLSTLDEAAVARVPAPGVWSPKQVLGHLTDSACNHQVRWVQMAAEPGLTLAPWNQEAWMAVQAWQAEPWADILALWYGQNRHLARFKARLTPEQLGHPANVGTLNGGQPMTLAQLLEHYARHLHHHLGQIRERVGTA